MTDRTRGLGGYIAERRRALSLSQSRAAILARASRTSWVAWENGTQMPEDYSRVKIERALEWQPGSVEGILSGREPIPIEAEPDRVDPAREDLMEKHKIDTRLFGLAEADRRLEQDIAEINAARERTSSRSSERPESA